MNKSITLAVLLLLGIASQAQTSNGMFNPISDKSSYFGLTFRASATPKELYKGNPAIEKAGEHLFNAGQEYNASIGMAGASVLLGVCGALLQANANPNRSVGEFMPHHLLYGISAGMFVGSITYRIKGNNSVKLAGQELGKANQ